MAVAGKSGAPFKFTLNERTPNNVVSGEFNVPLGIPSIETVGDWLAAVPGEIVIDFITLLLGVEPLNDVPIPNGKTLVVTPLAANVLLHGPTIYEPCVIGGVVVLGVVPVVVELKFVVVIKFTASVSKIPLVNAHEPVVVVPDVIGKVS